MKLHGAHHAHKNLADNLHVALGAVSIVVVLAVVLSFNKVNPVHNTGGLMFSVSSDGQLKIIPASGAAESGYTPTYTGTYTSTYQQCTTGPDSVEGGRGYRLSGGISNRYVNLYSNEFCITNSSGKNYFIPVKTPEELQRFINAIPGLTGVSKGEAWR